MENRNKPAFATDNTAADVMGLSKEEYATIEYVKALIIGDTSSREVARITGKLPDNYVNIVLAAKALARETVLTNTERERINSRKNI